LRVYAFAICPLDTSHWQLGIDWQVCGQRIIRASTRHGLIAAFG
jgi:hypothetical protein